MLSKNSIIGFIMSLVATIFLSFIIYQELKLLYFINISFLITITCLFISLLTLTVKAGFFDGISYGFRRMFVSKGTELSKDEVEEMKPVSELISFDFSPLLFTGLALGLVMLIGLYFYYV
ncbi:DUF3899 domain-containing protein [Metabacillus herbersteinensis]|uniref:DUF3899 domain-containing protein n=1 Tax=Metabacillus herbersteinensis TaxID=283816 RepID=A0ABV6GE75_9BACI